MARTNSKLKNRKGLLKMTGCLVLSIFTVLLFCSSALAIDFEVKDTKVTIGGYAKFMLIYDTDGKVETGPFEGDLIGPYDIPTDGHPNANSDDFRMIARESRLYVKTATGTEYGMFNTHVEGDWYGDGGSATWSNSRTFRIRHAYGQLTKGKHRILAGQTWSTFMDLPAAPPHMDFYSDPGICFVRQPMVRYSYLFGRGNSLSVSIENPDKGLVAMGPVPLVRNSYTSEEEVPDAIIKYFYASKWGHISPRVLLRKLELNGDDAFGYAFALSGHLKFGKGHKFQTTLTYGDGIGRYAGLGINTGAGVTDDGDAETVEFVSANVGFTFSLKPNVKLNFGAGIMEHDDDAYEGPDAVLSGNAVKEAFAWHANIMWNLTKKIQLAIGVADIDNELFDGREGDMMRIQSYAKYSF